jgi:hypothetical protein
MSLSVCGAILSAEVIVINGKPFVCVAGCLPRRKCCAVGM